MTESIPTTTTRELDVPDVGATQLTLTDRGQGPVYLLLHGGAGPQSVTAFAERLADSATARVITPTHPGFARTPRPAALASVASLAALYRQLLAELDVADVTIVGNSIGGWVAQELALLGSPRVSRLVLLDATGIDVPDHPITDVSSLTVDEIMALSFHDPAPFRIDPAALPPEAQDIAASNREALAAYGGGSRTDPTLRERLAQLALPTLVLWGHSDQIADPGYGRALADAIPGARFKLIPDTGHQPQLETPTPVLAAIAAFDRAAHNAPGLPIWSADHVVETNATPQQIWAALRALYTGTKLSEHSDTIELHGPFTAGSTLSVTPNGADFVIHCAITEMITDVVYAYRSELNDLLLTSRHLLIRLPNGGTRITHYQEITGPTATIAAAQLGPRITQDTPQAMNDLIAAASSRT